MQTLLEREVGRTTLICRALEHAIHRPDDWTADVDGTRVPVTVACNRTGAVLRVHLHGRRARAIILLVRNEPVLSVQAEVSNEAWVDVHLDIASRAA